MSTCIKEIPLGSHIAWSTEPENNSVLAVGQCSNNKNNIIFYDLNFSDSSTDSSKVLASVDLTSDSLITDLVWTAPYDSKESIIAVGKQDGVVNVWKPPNFANMQSNTSPKLLNEKALVLTSSKLEDTSISCLVFHAVQSSILLACGGTNGTLSVLNLKNFEKPEMCNLGSEVCQTHENSAVTGLSWNDSVPHIIASTCANGLTAIWNLKQRRAAIKFRDPANRKHTSGSAWISKLATQVIVTYDDDSNPSIQMWDLRNTSYPFKEIPGHSRGITCIKASPTDHCLFLTSGRDKRTVCWDMQNTGEPIMYSETLSTDYSKKVQWSNQLPSFFASVSSNDSITVDSIQKRIVSDAKYVPSWFSKPSGVTFGFGGKTVLFNTKLGSAIYQDVLATGDPEFIYQADEFDWVLENNDFVPFCENKIHLAQDDYEKLTWQTVQTLFFPKEYRKNCILEFLGYKEESLKQSIEGFFAKNLFSNIRDTPVTNQIDTTQHPVDAESFFNELSSKIDCEDSTQLTNLNTSKATSSPLPESCDWSKTPDCFVKSAILMNQKKLATYVCIESQRWADALLLAASSDDPELWEQTKTKYFQSKSQDKFFQLTYCIINQKWHDLVVSTDLSKWQETLAILASYTKDELFSDLTDQLGKRLEKELFDIRSAVICYIIAEKFSSAAQIWSTLSVSSGTGKSSTKILQELIVKLTLLRKATNFEEVDVTYNQKLSQYAEILANSGRIVPSMKLLNSMHSNSPEFSQNSVLIDRIYNSASQDIQKASASMLQRQVFPSVDVQSSFHFPQVSNQEFAYYDQKLDINNAQLPPKIHGTQPHSTMQYSTNINDTQNNYLGTNPVTQPYMHQSPIPVQSYPSQTQPYVNQTPVYPSPTQNYQPQSYPAQNHQTIYPNHLDSSKNWYQYQQNNPQPKSTSQYDQSYYSSQPDYKNSYAPPKATYAYKTTSQTNPYNYASVPNNPYLNNHNRTPENEPQNISSKFPIQNNQYYDYTKAYTVHKSTAPNASIADLPSDMPTPWPIPTQTQQGECGKPK